MDFLRTVDATNATLPPAKRSAWGLIAADDGGDSRKPTRAPFVLAADDGGPCSRASAWLEGEDVPAILDALLAGSLDGAAGDALLRRVLRRRDDDAAHALAAASDDDVALACALAAAVLLAVGGLLAHGVRRLVGAPDAAADDAFGGGDNVFDARDGLGNPPPPALDLAEDSEDEEEAAAEAADDFPEPLSLRACASAAVRAVAAYACDGSNWAAPGLALALLMLGASYDARGAERFAREAVFAAVSERPRLAAALLVDLARRAAIAAFRGVARAGLGGLDDAERRLLRRLATEEAAAGAALCAVAVCESAFASGKIGGVSRLASPETVGVALALAAASAGVALLSRLARARVAAYAASPPNGVGSSVETDRWFETGPTRP